jgi:hypothetical protein
MPRGREQQDETEPTAAQRRAARADARERRDEDRPMIPGRRGRSRVESAFVRLIATGGIVAIGVALGAILVGENVEGWIVGLVISLVTVILAALLWSSRRL